MTLVSFSFALFVLVLLPVYYRLPLRGQNGLLLLSSIGFAASVDGRGAVLLLLLTAADFRIGRAMSWEAPDARRLRLLWLSVFLDVGAIAAFKYLGPLETALLGRPHAVHPLVPVGLSFYTLARLSHTLDVYFRVIRPSERFLDFLLFSSFFPTFVSGPIERAKTFLPQLEARRPFDVERFYEALWLVALGLFKKVYVADTCALMVQDFLDADAAPNGSETFLGVYAYAIELYGDFAGYSDMARGVARLFGIDVMQNFDAPYFSPSLAEYWKRWHVSFSSFLDDYVFAPASMAFRTLGTLGVVLATFVTFLVSGLWHGTGFTFLVWGALHALGLSIYVVTRKQRKRFSKVAPRVLTVLGTAVTFAWVCFAYVFFQAESVPAAFATLSRLARPWTITEHIQDHWYDLTVMSVLLFGLDFLARWRKSPLWVFSQPVWIRAVCYGVVLFCIVRLHAPAEAFVYAQF
ncbi:MAG TPA: MBOAT family O-acyltransferase [Polyangiaceae bacterium]|nr:MBOAT family O-acyltransferase [Polyangiaceae bacterium]